MQFVESVTFAGNTHTDPHAPFPPNFFNFTDQFTTKNNFYGALCGLQAQCMYHAWKLHAIMTGGIGLMRNGNNSNGSSKTATGNLFFLTANTAQQTLKGAIFTQPSNIGCFKHHACAGMVETIIRCSYSLKKDIELSLGYNFILLTHVGRAADQIDRNINTTRTSLADLSRATVGIGTGPIPFGMAAAAPAAHGDYRPKPLCKTKNFWTQGLIAGLTIYF